MFRASYDDDPRYISCQEYLQSNVAQHVSGLSLLHDVMINRYVPNGVRGGNIVLQHHDVSSDQLEVRSEIGWVVEQYRKNKDYFHLASGLVAEFGIKPQQAGILLRSLLADCGARQYTAAGERIEEGECVEGNSPAPVLIAAEDGEEEALFLGVEKARAASAAAVIANGSTERHVLGL
jgi:hypothetical protein